MMLISVFLRLSFHIQQKSSTGKVLNIVKDFNHFVILLYLCIPDVILIVRSFHLQYFSRTSSELANNS